MVKEEIRLKKSIVHILDATVGMAILSETQLEYGSDFADFLKEHIAKITSGDDAKTCTFYEKESEIFQLLTKYQEIEFVDISQKIANNLYDIMNSNVDIPSADLIIVEFRESDIDYLGILKMNYKTTFTHKTTSVEDGNVNEIIKFKATLPGNGQKLSEAAIIRLTDFNVQLLEKKYEVNGEKVNYFSELFLKCSSKLSHKSKLNLVTKAIEKVQKTSLGESYACEEIMKAKSIIQEELNSNGGFVVEDLGDKLFEEKEDLRVAFQEEIEKYNLVKEEIIPQSESTIKKYQKQHLFTDKGIEIKIPMDQYKDVDSVEFITNEDGTISVLIKNIGHLEAKY
ncbi:MAG: nucleoid-associated protein [Lachnospiraceae bacterium]